MINGASAGHVPPGAFGGAERETFLAAIERHRRACWRVNAACGVAVVLLAFVVAVLMAPLFYCAFGLIVDVANLITPMPDVLGWAGREIDAVVSADVLAPAPVLLRTGLMVALPGAALIAAAAYALHRVWTSAREFATGDVGRPPDRGVLAEQRLANVVEEMAVAAGIDPPAVLIVPGGVNASAFGVDDARATLLVGEGAIDGVNRDELEGMIAHLVGSIVNGDMPIGVRVSTVLSLFGLLTRAGSALTEQRGAAYLRNVWRVMVAPRSPRTLAAMASLTQPFGDAAARRTGDLAAGKAGSGLTWREWLTMPLMGPMFLSGFLSGLVSQMFLRPLIALAWRQRKYMADAAAVQLTRNPDALAGALSAIVDSPTAIASWTAHLAVAPDPRGRDGVFGGSIPPIFPSAENRVAALRRMGAHIALPPRQRMPRPIAVVIGVLTTVMMALAAIAVFLLVLLSTALSGLCTIFPAAALHYVLRWAARR